jgi:hypothetical protein
MHQAAKERALVIGVPPSAMGLVVVSGLSWSAGGYGQKWESRLYAYWTCWRPSFQVRVSRFYINTGRPYECFIKEQRRPSITRQSPPNNPRECDNITATRPSYDFSSIGQPPRCLESRSRGTHRHTLRHQCSCFGNPVSPSIATTMTVTAAPEPVESNITRPRPPSGNPTTTTGSSIRYSAAVDTHQPPTHSIPSPAHKLYRSAWALQVP